MEGFRFELLCGNLTIFLPIRFYVKSILTHFRWSKSGISTILENFLIFLEILALSNGKDPSKSKFRTFETTTISHFELLDYLNIDIT